LDKSAALSSEGGSVIATGAGDSATAVGTGGAGGAGGSADFNPSLADNLTQNFTGGVSGGTTNPASPSAPLGLSAGLQSVADVGGFNPPAALTQDFASGGNTTSSSTTNNYRTTHVNPSIHVNVTGDKSGMTDLHSQVVDVVKTAIRRGSLSFSSSL
jgi:hypothetical protein